MIKYILLFLTIIIILSVQVFILTRTSRKSAEKFFSKESIQPEKNKSHKGI
ncbi:MAG: hypothetical protein N2645_15845 [Clostridia bacterium]|nr:hypothetical protein [Clostridia bacterium]